jgi:hypothetical protein
MARHSFPDSFITLSFKLMTIVSASSAFSDISQGSYCGSDGEDGPATSFVWSSATIFYRRQFTTFNNNMNESAHAKLKSINFELCVVFNPN